MLAYKPKEDPILIKIAKSGMFQFLMVVLLGVAVTTFVVRTDQPQQWIQKINRFASVAPNPKAKTEAGIAEDQAEFEAPPPQANTWATRTTSPTSEMAADGAVTAGAPQAQAFRTGTGDVSPTQTVSATAKLRIQMVEIDHDYLNSIMNERYGDRTALGGDIIFYKSNAPIKLNTTNARILKTDIMIFGETNNNAISAGSNARWIRLAINAQDIRSALKMFSLMYIKNHPNDAQQIPIDFSLSPGEQLYLSGTGLLTYFDLEPDLANAAPFTIFKSTDYRNQKTTFAIIIDLQ
ncbi:hypothetical protein [Pseudobdellovibrio sp. HCB154]|uniref:hypothetical protein n=1 Tax=Pseudobdellovibrio sp. HCB154 TaxID=3386277 RepID=UPI003916D996